MFQLIFCAVILATAQETCADVCFDDTPFTNFTWDIDEIKGECIHIKALRLEEDLSKYEGRWYAVFIGMTPEKISALNCFVWDTFFDEKGYFHNFVHMEENGSVKVIVDVGKPIDAKNGIYEFDVGHNKSAIKFTSTYFYLDEDILVFWHVDCPQDKNIRRQEAVIGFRRFADIEKNKDKIDMVYKELANRGAETTSHQVRHENCNYPAERKNPYIKRKKHKQTNCDNNPHEIE